MGDVEMAVEIFQWACFVCIIWIILRPVKAPIEIEVPSPHARVYRVLVNGREVYEGHDLTQARLARQDALSDQETRLGSTVHLLRDGVIVSNTRK